MTHNEVRQLGLQVVHSLAMAGGIFGLYFIIVESLDSAVYGLILFGVAFTLEIIVGAYCHDKTADVCGRSSCPLTDTRPVKHR